MHDDGPGPFCDSLKRAIPIASLRDFCFSACDATTNDHRQRHRSDLEDRLHLTPHRQERRDAHIE